MFEKDIFYKLLGEPKIEGSEYIYFCPYCRYVKKKLSINYNKNKFKCWHCNRGGSSLIKIIYDFGSDELIQRAKQYFNIGDGIDKYKVIVKKSSEEKKDNTFDFCEFEKNIDLYLFNHYHDDSNEYVNYLKKERNLEYRDFIYWKPFTSSIEKYKNYVFFPSYDSNFRMNYFVARDITNTEKVKYQTPFGVSKDSIIFNEYNIDWSKPVTLVEGIFDAISSGQNSIPILGSSLDKNSKILEKIILSESEVYLMCDGDAQDKSFKIIRSFLKHGTIVKYVPLPENLDPNNMTKEEIKICKMNYVEFNSEFELNLKEKYE